MSNLITFKSFGSQIVESEAFIYNLEFYFPTLLCRRSELLLTLRRLSATFVVVNASHLLTLKHFVFSASHAKRAYSQSAYGRL